ncbi:MAG: DUF370 domain-containing protein [Ruminococcaceae bacterium]|nr:DUF370 domain-containing protein [Oscillospiraceae bacterium]
MYLHLGNETVIKTDDIVGIFDLDTSTVSKHTRDYLSLSEKNRQVFTVSFELPKSFILCDDGKNQKIYICQLSSKTLQKRLLSRKDANL